MGFPGERERDQMYIKLMVSHRTRYNVDVHVQLMHARMIGSYVKYIFSYRARYNVYVHVQPMHAIMIGNYVKCMLKPRVNIRIDWEMYKKRVQKTRLGKTNY
jgi:hypothetical protein